ncbi:MAG TPA: hypothetical protein VGN17_21595 [Bryobacteraceae bacterium]|jgi:hypothetical protein
MLWQVKPGDGAPMMIDGRERDCLFFDEFVTHYIECTISRTLDKVRSDASKMVQYRTNRAKKGGLVKLWIITREEPTADQNTEARRSNIEILSLAEFQRRVFDAATYLEARRIYPFGSATNPENDSTDVTKVRYQNTAIHKEPAAMKASVRDVAGMLTSQGVVALLGDYGMGKSLTIREVFLLMRQEHLKRRDTPIPVVINLRDHWGQDDPYEVLERHAKRVGIGAESDRLIKAFNTGRLTIILDGFDETSTKPWSSRTELKEIRIEAVTVVRNFVDLCRGKRTGVLLAGREHFFDSRKELLGALGLRAGDTILGIGEFSDEEAREFLQVYGFGSELPSWLPRRPLLLASLASQGFLDSLVGERESPDPAAAWDQLLTGICNRESRIHGHLEPGSIREILEILASRTRESLSGMGPLTESQILEAFRVATGADPDASARPLLMRLPCLSIRNAEKSTRTFLDDQMLDVFRAGPVAGFAVNPYTAIDGSPHWKHALGEVGAAVAIVQLKRLHEKPAVQALTAMRVAQERWKSPTLSLDLLEIARIGSEFGEDQLDCGGLVIEGGCTAKLDLSTQPIPAQLRLVEMEIQALILPGVPVDHLQIEESLIERVFGASGRDQVPQWMTSCEVGTYDPASTNASVLQMESLPLSVRVFITILRKLYYQAGFGRQEGALFRGMPPEARDFVPQVLPILTKEELAHVATHTGRRVWHAYRDQLHRVMEMVEAPQSSNDPAIRAVRDLR